MAPTQSTVSATPTSRSSADTSAHQVSVPAMIVLALVLLMMAAIAISVIHHQRKLAATLRRDKTLHEKTPSARANSPWLSRFKPNWNLTEDNPTAVGALHAATALLAAAPCQVFSSPMTMHFRIPLQDKTVLILGAPWFPARCGAQCCAPADAPCDGNSFGHFPP